MLAELPNLGYVVPAEKDRLSPQGDQLAITRELATRGELRLRLNQDAKLLGVEGKQVNEVLEAFRALRNLCLERLDPSKGFKSAFVEVTGDAWIATGKEPITVFSKVWSENPVFDRLNRRLETNFTQRGIRIVSSLDVENASFHEIEIIPHIPSKSRYHVGVIWREPTVDSILRVMGELESNILRTIQELESF